MTTPKLPGAGAFGLGQYEIAKIGQEVGFGLLVVLVGASATYFAESVAPKIDQSTTIGLAAAAILRVAVEVARRWLSDNRTEKR